MGQELEVGDRYLLLIEDNYYREATVVYVDKKGLAIFYLDTQMMGRLVASGPISGSGSEYETVKKNCSLMGFSHTANRFITHFNAVQLVKELGAPQQCIHCGIALNRCEYHGPR